MLEHGAYCLLLDRCYATERGIPDGQAHRLARAKSKDELAAVNAVLAEFFTLDAGEWKNGRAIREIEKTQTKITASRENGKRGGRPKRTQQQPGGLCTGYETRTQDQSGTNLLQSPVTKHQTPDTKHNPPVTPPTELWPDPAGRMPQELIAVDPPEARGHTPTAAGALCRKLRQAGIADVNPGHPRLLALLQAGATDAEFLGFAPAALKAGQPFAYLIGVVEGERIRAAENATLLHRGPIPLTGRAAENAQWITGTSLDRNNRKTIKTEDENAARIALG